MNKYLKLSEELLEQIKNKTTLRGEMRMKAFGFDFIGQGYMVKSYRSINHDDFLSHLKKEVEFVKYYKQMENINIIDAGANLGFYSIAYSIISGTSVISFEPFPDTYKQLEKNITYNKISNITALQLGLFSKKIDMPIGQPMAFNFYSFLTKIFKFTDKEQLGCYSVYTKDKNAKNASFIKGDDCKEILEKDHIDFIKIDVEGSELEVLKGMSSTIVKHSPVLKIEFNEHSFKAAGVTNESVWNYLSKLGYKKYSICSGKGDYLNWISMEIMPSIKGSKDFLFIV